MSNKEIKFYKNMPLEEFDELTEEIKCNSCEFCMPDGKTKEYVCASKYYGAIIRSLSREQIENCDEHEESFISFMNR